MARSRVTLLSVLGWLLIVGSALPAHSQEAKAALSVAAQPGEWRYLNSDPQSTRYSPLDQAERGTTRVRTGDLHSVSSAAQDDVSTVRR
jgi:hypothetical protein